MLKSRLLVAFLSVSFIGVGSACGDDSSGDDRWVQTDNTNVKIDWDKINEAYKTANGPDDLEKKVNEIYEGDEVISVQVKDESKEVQTVTGFFDKDKNGQVDEGEKIFSIKRDLHAPGKAQYQTTGYGHYHGYSSPMYPLMTGMVTGMMISAMWSPHYMPMYYSRPYITSYSRVSTIHSTRSSYRTANPSRFSGRSGGTSGRSYGGGGRSGGGTSGRSGGGGGSFGVRLKGPKTRITA
jgi:hypothetical protein